MSLECICYSLKNAMKWEENHIMAMSMKKKKWKCVLILIVTLVVGSLLHNVYVWFPNTFTALIAPVNESLWEHTKIIFYPLLLAGFFCNREKDTVIGTAWGLSAVVSSLLMLGAAYLYHRILGQDSFWFDIALYAVSIVLGFVLARVFCHLTEQKGWRVAGKAVTWGMFLLILLRTKLN